MAAVDTVLDAALDNTPVAALIADDDRRYVAANTAAYKLLGLAIEELRQKRIDDLVPLEARHLLDNAGTTSSAEEYEATNAPCYYPTTELSAGENPGFDECPPRTKCKTGSVHTTCMGS